MVSRQLSHLLQQDADLFRKKTRMCKQTFLVALGLISDDAIFHNLSRNPQRPAGIQLYCYAVTIAHQGTGESLGIIAGDLNLGCGTVTSYFHRVCRALLNKVDAFIKWPSASKRRADSAQAMQDCGLYSFGIIDGTHVYFSQAPAVDSHNFFTRKKVSLFMIHFVNCRCLTFLSGAIWHERSADCRFRLAHCRLHSRLAWLRTRCDFV
jgi:hypothetical protein